MIICTFLCTADDAVERLSLTFSKKSNMLLCYNNHIKPISCNSINVLWSLWWWIIQPPLRKASSLRRADKSGNYNVVRYTGRCTASGFNGALLIQYSCLHLSFETWKVVMKWFPVEISWWMCLKCLHWSSALYEWNSKNARFKYCVRNLHYFLWFTSIWQP